jgi:hypothetical protein
MNFDFTLAESQIITVIKAHYQLKGYSPSREDIAANLGVGRESGGLTYCLRKMRAAGQIHYDDGIARSFRLPGQKVTFD